MNALIRIFIDICLLRAGPQQLPHSTALMWLSVAAYATVGVVSGLSYFGDWRALGASLLDTLLLAATLQLVLGIGGHRERLTKALTAVTGSWALIGLLALPLLFAVNRAAEGEGGGALLGLLVLLGWSLAVLGHVLRHALEISLMAALGISVAYFLISQILVQAVFPLPVS